MPYKKKGKSKSVKYPFPLIIAGTGLITIAFAVMIILPSESSPADTTHGDMSAPATLSYPAPDIELVDISGASVSLTGLSGQVILVNNWATWCPPCRDEMPALQAYYQAHKDDGFVLVGINSGDQPEQVVAFQQEYGLTFPLWLDPTGLALRSFKNNALPSSYVIDETGTVRYLWMGAVSREALETFVTPLLGSN
jgi:peroxiredoxin